MKALPAIMFVLALTSVATSVFAEVIKADAVSSPELCVLERLIGHHQKGPPGLTHHEVRSELMRRSELCSPAEFYNVAAQAMARYGDRAAGKGSVRLRHRDPAPSKTVAQQRSELMNMTAPELCTVQAFTNEAATSANGITHETVSAVLTETGARCQPKDFYHFIARSLAVHVNESVTGQHEESRVGLLGFLGDVASAYAKGMSDSTDSARRHSEARGKCTSDFSCEFGQACVKRLAESEGVCMIKVGSDGLQTFEGPNAESVLPNVGRDFPCGGKGRCPRGFRCDVLLGACVK